jgi:transposase-like protein
LLVALGVRADGQKMLLAIKSMGGESEAAWRARLDDFVRRGLPTSELVVVDGAPGLEKALAAYGPTWPSNAAPVHKHRNLLVHAPERLHEEISNDHRDRIYAATRGRGRDPAQGVHPQMAPQMPGRRRQLGGSWRQAVHLHPVPAEPMEVDPNLERDRAIA